MGRKITKETRMIEQFLKGLFPHHPSEFRPAAYRYNPTCVRVRLVDAQFQGLSRLERQRRAEEILATLPDKIQSDIFFIALLAPTEVNQSALNDEFEHPSPEPLRQHEVSNGRQRSGNSSKLRIKRGSR